MYRNKNEYKESGKMRFFHGNLLGTFVKAFFLAGVALICLMIGGETRGEGTGQVTTSKSIPESTVAVIDPESGTSTGGGSTDVNLAVGDIISFRIHFSSIPDNDLRGIQAYITDYIPANTEVVGVRILDENGLTIAPNLPGLAPDDCGRPCDKFDSLPCDNSVPGCVGGTRSLDPGTISQVYADTGFFYTLDDRLARDPSDVFLTTDNGILMSPEPNSVGRISSIIGVSSPFYAHNEWDWTEVRSFGTSTSADGGKGTGSTPYLYGSPVAGPEAFYKYEGTEVSPGVIQFNDVEGPWDRIFYPGSQIGYGDPGSGSGGVPTYNCQPTMLGWDVTPNNPLPSGPGGTVAVRAALGEVRPGVPGTFEISLRVLDTPLDPIQNQDVNCGEVFSSEVAGSAASHNPWPFYLTSPGCAYLNLKFDIDVDKDLADGGELLTYTVSGKNLSTNPQHNVVIKQKYDNNTVQFSNATDGGTLVTNCDGDGLDCVVWNLGDLQPSDEYVFYSTFTAGGTGQRLVPMRGNYTSTELPAPGFTTSAVTVIRAAPVIKVDMENSQLGTLPGDVALVEGIFTNSGTGGSTWNDLLIVLPAGWTIVDGSVTLGGTVLSCINTGTNTPTCTMNRSFAVGESQDIFFDVNVPTGIPNGIYNIDLFIRVSTQAFGSFDTSFPNAAEIPVGADRSDPPTIDCPIDSGATSITGTTNGADGTVIRVYFNAIERDSDPNAIGGLWEVNSFPTTFGEFYSGLEARATAQAPGELESEFSNVCTASSLFECMDGIDNDGDGLTDFPYDPGCESPWDNSEEDRDPYDYTGVDLPICWDGIDHDLDGNTDFPDDPGCISWFDDSEDNFIFPDDDLKARLLIVFDTSGSMNWNVCEDVFTGGDGSEECPGEDIPCVECNSNTCDDGLPNDSRLYKAKEGLTMAVSAYGNVEWALMRFHQRAEEFQCPVENASLRSGGWQGSGAAPCVGEFNTGDLLVRFAPHNAWHILEWMNHSSNYPDVNPPPGLDQELRGSGTTPLGGSLMSAYDYLTEVKFADGKVECREYRVILVTDGEETCGGDPVAAASGLNSEGLPVHVIGFATNDQSVVDNLDAIAQAGGTDSAVFADDSAALSAAIAQIVSDSFVVELCNEIDDDCNGLTDETFPLKGEPCDDGKLGICKGTGIYVCAEDHRSVVCDITDPGLAPREEECNGLDDDCNGIIDDVDPVLYPDGCNPPPDLCDPDNSENEGLDDPRVGQVCGTNEGECQEGITICVEGEIVCDGEITPQPEVCDGLDNNCNGLIDDGLARPCYETRDGYPEGCIYDVFSETWSCVGACRTGIQLCEGGVWGVCQGYVSEKDEVCNNVDDNCDGQIDEDLTQPCQESSDWGTCTGTETCVAGEWVECDAQIPEEEICDGKDNNCDGITDMVSEECYLAETPGCTFDEGTETWNCVGRCNTGSRLCVDGVFGGCNGAQTPGDELCNNLDDNCDGTTDKDENGDPITESCYTGPPGTEGVGVCTAGVRTCTDGTWSGCVGEVTPSAEVCDGQDNNCDGETDEGLGQTTCGLGECEKTIENCVDGITQECDPYEGATPEMCDGLDNNCDGITDGLVETCYTFGTGCGYDGDTDSWHCEGVCTTGIRRCPTPDQGGNGEWGQCEYQQGPVEEVCDGRDNNCNGLTDEDENGDPLSRACYPPGSGTDTGCVYDENTDTWTCEGICQAGERLCTSGQWQACTNYITPQAEICNNLDDNCDGQTDEPENMPGLGMPCGSAIGRCTQGTLQCIDGQEICQGGEGPFEGECNGMDDNCDGVIDDPDEVSHLEGEPCGSSVGECEPGETECVGGEIICTGGRQPTEEICNGLDDDCDGETDNGAVCPPNSHCYDGACRPICDPGDEFGCPPNTDCENVYIDEEEIYLCLPVTGDCGGETCPDGWICVDDECVDPCADVDCEPWEECRQGVCMDQSCTAFGIDCPPDQFCINHECVDDPCVDSDCDSETEFCLRDCDESGCTYQCEALCACPPGERCTAHADCVEDLCHEVTCTGSNKCNPDNGQCEPDDCYDVNCPMGQTCYKGECIEDPCNNADCPAFHECRLVESGDSGPIPQCSIIQSYWDPGSDSIDVLATGKGGCGCRTVDTPASRSRPLTLFFLFMLSLIILRSGVFTGRRSVGRGGQR